jgi:uroporphyrin-3 C-methyltransferase
MTDTTEENSEDSSTDKAGKKGYSKIILLNSCLLIALIGFSYYNFKNYNQVLNTISLIEERLGQTSEYEASINSIGRNNASLETQINAASNSIDLVEQSLASLYDEISVSSSNWNMAEVEHLYIIAVQQLELDKDVNTALAAVLAADKLLSGVSDPDIIEIRRMTTADINGLRSVNIPDVTGMTLTLSDISSRLESLPLKQTSLNENSNTISSDVNDPESSRWSQFFSIIWNDIKSLVSISRQSEETILSLLPEQKYYLYQNLILEINVARAAILLRDSDNLHNSSDVIIKWLNDYFNTDDAGVKNIINAVTALKGVELNPKLPDLGNSLHSISAYISENTE